MRVINIEYFDILEENNILVVFKLIVGKESMILKDRSPQEQALDLL